MSGSIYFVRSGGWVKVGFAKNVRRRICELQIGNPERLTLLASVSGSIDEERALHQALIHQAGTKKRGEWFEENHAVKLTLCLVEHQFDIQRILDALNTYRLLGDIMKRCNWAAQFKRTDELKELDTRFDNVRRLLSDLLGGNGDIIPIEPKHRKVAA